MTSFPNLTAKMCKREKEYLNLNGLTVTSLAHYTCVTHLYLHVDTYYGDIFFDVPDYYQFIKYIYDSPLLYLNMSGTPLSRIQGEQGLVNLQVLDLTHCQLHDINPKFFFTMENLRYLNISNNSLPSAFFNKDPFTKLINLEELYLNTLSLNSFLNSELFTALIHLKILSLRHNFLTIFHFNMAMLRNLEILDLGHNDINKFDSRLSDLKQLHTIDISYNKMNTLSKEMIDELTELSINHNLRIVDLTGNLFNCSCFRLDFINFIINSTLHLKKRELYRCFSEFHEKNIYISDFISDEVLDWCDKIQTQMNKLIQVQKFGYLIVTTSMLLMIISVSYVIYNFRWKLRWIFYKKMRTLRRKFEMHKIMDEVINLSRKYHAFVSYNHDKDYEWVANDMVSKVEEEWGYSLCIGQRDFVAGAPIAENIVNAVENSHLTLIILTPDFISSHWCEFELHMALTRGHQHVVICYIRKVEEKKLTKVMKRLIKTLTYIEYGDDEDHNEFWVKLHNKLLDVGAVSS